MTALRAVYRLDLGAGTDVAALRGRLAYLVDLGISHLSLSSAAAEARVGATGGDAVDRTAAWAVLGGDAGLQALAAAARGHGIGLVYSDADPERVQRILRTEGGTVRYPGPVAMAVGRGPGADVQALFVDPAGAEPLGRLWAELAPDDGSPLVAGSPPAGSGRRSATGAGGDRAPFSLPVPAFHAACARRWPQGLQCDSPRDAWPSGDVSARLGFLSCIGDEWAGAVRRWRIDNAGLRVRPGAPTPREELLVYQTLVGAWPIGIDRLAAHLVAVLREAGQTTSPEHPDEQHEQAVVAFALALMEHGPFRYGFDGWAARVAEVGARQALGQTLLRLTCPGVPELRAGDETLSLTLTGADEQRQVAWDDLAQALAALRAGAAPTRERAKLHLVWRALALRAACPEAFAGAYTPVAAGDGVCAFLRGDDVLVAVAVRESVSGAEGWALPASAAGAWRDELSGAEHELPDHASLASVLGPDGRALLRRA